MSAATLRAVPDYNELHTWLKAELANGITKSGPKAVTLWGLCKEHIEPDPERWKRWVLKCCAEARKPQVNEAEAVVYSQMRDGSPDDLPDSSEPAARAISNQTPEEYAEFKARAHAARTQPPEPSPPMRYFLPLTKRVPKGEAWPMLKAEWENQGTPFADDFDPAPLGLVKQ